MSPDATLDAAADSYEQIQALLADACDGDERTIIGGDDLDILLTRYQLEYRRRLDWEQEGDSHRIEPVGSLDDGELLPFDVRSIPPQRRHEVLTGTFANLDPGQGFVLINGHDPRPLYHQFDAEAGEQFHWEYQKQSPGEFRVLTGKSESVGHRPTFESGGGGHGHGHSCGHYSGSEAKAHPFTGGMKPTIGNLSTFVATAGVR